MATLVVGSEKNLKDLRPRLFDGKVTAAVAKRAGAAIADANPGVDVDALMPGTVLAIPDLPELVLGPALADDALHDGLAGSDEQLRASLKALSKEAAVADRTERAERKKARAALGDPQVEDLAASDPELATEVEDARRALEAEDGAAKDRAAALDEAIAEWTAELDALRGGGR